MVQWREYAIEGWSSHHVRVIKTDLGYRLYCGKYAKKKFRGCVCIEDCSYFYMGTSTEMRYIGCSGKIPFYTTYMKYFFAEWRHLLRL